MISAYIWNKIYHHTLIAFRTTRQNNSALNINISYAFLQWSTEYLSKPVTYTEQVIYGHCEFRNSRAYLIVNWVEVWAVWRPKSCVIKSFFFLCSSFTVFGPSTYYIMLRREGGGWQFVICVT